MVVDAIVVVDSDDVLLIIEESTDGTLALGTTGVLDPAAEA